MGVQESEAVRSGRIAEFVALDSDPATLTRVEREQKYPFLRTINSSVRAILAGKIAAADFDLVYAAGLYDYLPSPVAKRMTTRLFSALRLGGRLLVANFAPQQPLAGYMEAFMDWWLIHRSEQEVDDLSSEIAPSDIAEKHLFRDSVGNVVYLMLTRMSAVGESGTGRANRRLAGGTVKRVPAGQEALYGQE